MRTVHLVTIKPGKGLPAHVALIKWPKACGVPDPEDESRPWARQLTGNGMICQVDDNDMVEARTLGEVTVHDTREVDE